MTRLGARPVMLLVLVLILFLAPSPAVEAQSFPAPANVQVTRISSTQFQVCWQSVSGADNYPMVDQVTVYRTVAWVTSSASGTICTTVSLFQNDDEPNSCLPHRVSVQAGIISGDSFVGGPSSAPYPILLSPAFEDPTAPVPWCDPADAFLSPAYVDARPSSTPSGLAVTDTSTSSAATIKITLTCPAAPTGWAKDHYEIYESLVNTNATTTTRTTSNGTCPNNKTLTGSFGQRVTVGVAAVYSQGSGQNKIFMRSRCSAPVTTTYGGILIPTPVLTVPATANATNITISGSVPTTSVINVLLFVNPSSFNQSTPTQTITSFTQSGPNKTFTATIPLNPTLNTVYAVTRTGSGTSTRYSKPSSGYFVKNYSPPLAAPTWGSLPAYQVGGSLYLTGTTAPGARVVVTPTAPGGSILPSLTGDACTDGTFGVTFPIAGLSAGIYTFAVRSTDAGSAGENTASVHINELFPPPTLALDLGVGPAFVRTTPIFLRGIVTPATAGPGFTVTGRLGVQTVTAIPNTSGVFTLPALTLAQGSNSITVSAIYNPTGQTPAPVATTVIYDTAAPTATATMTTQIPNPTNVATWTLNGIITGFQDRRKTQLLS